MLLSVLIFEDVTLYRSVSVFRRFEGTTFLDPEIFVLYRRLLMVEFVCFCIGQYVLCLLLVCI